MWLAKLLKRLTKTGDRRKLRNFDTRVHRKARGSDDRAEGVRGRDRAADDRGGSVGSGGASAYAEGLSASTRPTVETPHFSRRAI